MEIMQTANSSQRIAIIGSGIAGLTAAHLLCQKHDVTVYEANDYIGGHTHTVPVSIAGKTHYVDTGFIVCNDRNYPNFLKIMDRLSVPLQDTEMSFSVRNEALDLEYNGHDLNTLFSQRRNLIRPRFLKLVRDILRFNSSAKQMLTAGNGSELSLGEYVKSLGLGKDFKENYLLPMVAAIWSCSEQQAAEFPLLLFLRFFHHHGLLDVKNRPQWHVLKGGSHSYVNPITEPFADRIRLNTKVKAIQRSKHSVDVITDDRTESFEQVILACHSDQALRLLDNPFDSERTILSALEYQENQVFLHSDANIMPRHKLSWASWNFRTGNGSINAAPQVTYCMNILQGLNCAEPILVSLNCHGEIADKKVLQEFCYEHPVYSRRSLAAQERRREICGLDRVHYCGAYWYSGFHEDGVRSALDVCARFGITL